MLVAILVVAGAQFAFTYAPLMHDVFDSRPVGLVDGLVVVAAGVVLMAILETEKALLRRLGMFSEMT